MVYNRLTGTEKALIAIRSTPGAITPAGGYRALSVPCAQDNRNLEEIWISSAVDANQIFLPKKVVQLTGQSFELLAATIGEDDVKLFKYSHVRLEGPRNPDE